MTWQWIALTVYRPVEAIDSGAVRIRRSGGRGHVLAPAGSDPASGEDASGMLRVCASCSRIQGSG